MVDWGVIGDEARGLDERLRGYERDKLAQADAVANDVVDLLLLLWAVESPGCCRFVLAAGACAVGKKDLPDCIEFHKGDGVKNATILISHSFERLFQKNGGGDGVGVRGIIGGIFTTTIYFLFLVLFFFLPGAPGRALSNADSKKDIYRGGLIAHIWSMPDDGDDRPSLVDALGCRDPNQGT